MSFELWIVYAAAAIGLSLTPGPNGLLALTHGVRFGVGRAVFTVAGGVTGFVVLMAASLAGLGALLAASERAFTVVKWIGAAYLVYLGIRLWSAPPPAVDPGAGGGGVDARRSHLFLQGFAVAVSNPKALIFIAAFLPQFMVPGASYWMQLAVLAGTFAVVEFVYELIVAASAQRVAPWLARHGRWFNRITGTTFVGIGALLAAARRS